MTSSVSRRSVAAGLAWSVPTVAVATAAPFAAASPTVPEIYFECPTTYENIFNAAGSLPRIGSAAAQAAYDPNGILAAHHMEGTVFGITFDPDRVSPVPLYNQAGDVVKQSSGLYLLPGCGATTCTPDVPGGFTMPQDGAVVYDGYGARRSGRIVSATPTGCSPSTNDGTIMSWNIETDVLFNGAACKDIIGPENLVRQISIPVSLVYLDGLKVVNTKTGGSCCLYLNLYFDPATNTCGAGQLALSTAQFTGWDITASVPAAPTTLLATAPHVDVVKTPAGANTKNFTATDNVRTVIGGGFTGATSVTWNGISVPFTVVDDNTLAVTLPKTGSLNGIFYPLVVTSPAGSSPTTNNTTLARY